MTVRWSVDEDAAVREAARQLGLTPTGFVAYAALTAAREHGHVLGGDREALGELIAARSQLRRYGNNVNQAVQALHSVGQAPAWLINAVRLTDQAVHRVDQAAERLTQANAVRPHHDPGADETPRGGPPSPAPPVQCDEGDR